MSSVKKEARLSGMLLARKGKAHPAHTDHKLTVQVMDQFAGANSDNEPPKEFSTNQSDNGSLVEAVNEINQVTKRQYNNVIKDVNKTLQAETAEKPVATTVEPEVKIAPQAAVVSRKETLPVEDADLAQKRIAMTLRMETADHLKLRLYAAHSRKSCQEIISEALEVYLDKDEKVCGLSDCNCLTS